MYSQGNPSEQNIACVVTSSTERSIRFKCARNSIKTRRKNYAYQSYPFLPYLSAYSLRFGLIQPTVQGVFFFSQVSRTTEEKIVSQISLLSLDHKSIEATTSRCYAAASSERNICLHFLVTRVYLSHGLSIFRSKGRYVKKYSREFIGNKILTRLPGLQPSQL